MVPHRAVSGVWGDTTADGSKDTERRKARGERKGGKGLTGQTSLTRHNTPTTPKVTPGWVFNLVSSFR